MDFAEAATCVMRIIDRVATAEHESDALRLLIEARDLMGVEQAVFASFIQEDLSTDNIRFLVAANAAWCLDYHREWWYAQDPWLLYAAAHSEPAVDACIPVRSHREKSAVDLARTFGVNSAYIVPAPASGFVSRVGVLMLGSAQSAFFSDPARMVVLKPLSRSLAMELHEWWIARIRSEMIRSHRLCSLDLELLRLERAGEPTKSIARRCSVTSASVDSRFQRLNAKLGVPNRRMAARIAAEYGLI